MGGCLEDRTPERYNYAMPEMVRITDVSPRDGLQNEPGFVMTSEKARLVELLVDALVDEVELTSFVSGKRVPQLADADELLETVLAFKRPDVVYSALVPNIRGLDRLLAASERAGMPLVDKVALFTAASEEFNRKNTGASIGESIERFAPVVAKAREAGLQVRAYVSCVIECPYEGPVEPAKVGEVVARLGELDPDEIDLGDTIGAATPESIVPMLDAARQASAWAEAKDPLTWVLHLHDTHGRAADCVEAALDAGIRSFDGAAGGLGGCPFAAGPGERAPGNIATRGLIERIHAKGFETRVNLDRLERASVFAGELVEQAEDQHFGGRGLG